MSTEPKWVIVAIEGSKRWYFDSAETHAEAREKQVKWNHRAATDPGWSEMAFVLEKCSEPESFLKRKLDLKMPEGWNDPRQEPRDTDGRECGESLDAVAYAAREFARLEPKTTG